MLETLELSIGIALCKKKKNLILETFHVEFHQYFRAGQQMIHVILNCISLLLHNPFHIFLLMLQFIKQATI